MKPFFSPKNVASEAVIGEQGGHSQSFNVATIKITLALT
jgi:hypothetical protein